MAVFIHWEQPFFCKKRTTNTKKYTTFDLLIFTKTYAYENANK
jgi:hypothetical protein